MQGVAASFKLDTAAAEKTTLDEIDLMLGVNPVCTPEFQFSDERGVHRRGAAPPHPI
ncbi:MULTISPECIES: hypothetical protein [Streptomyces]|uniref:Uncharacterized protein n=1 Tax=Streptomyces ramulosus TaxID=47762 RepID=A0ABW1FGT2_9ACTN